jgi:plastocyanin
VCYDKCAQAWPPLLTAGAPKTGDGADAALLGTTARTDGTTQVTYNGWPLYYYVKDQKPGDVTGQDVGGVWYMLSSKGDKIETSVATASSAPAPAGQAKTVKVAIKNFSFGAPLTIAVGTTVVWTNDDAAPHTVTASNGAFDSGNLDKGASYSFTFTQEGTYNYVCQYHPGMKGQIVVTK